MEYFYCIAEGGNECIVKHDCIDVAFERNGGIYFNTKYGEFSLDVSKEVSLEGCKVKDIYFRINPNNEQ